MNKISDEKDRKAVMRQARTPEELSRDRQKAKEGMSQGRGARTPEEVSHDRHKTPKSLWESIELIGSFISLEK